MSESESENDGYVCLFYKSQENLCAYVIDASGGLCVDIVIRVPLRILPEKAGFIALGSKIYIIGGGGGGGVNVWVCSLSKSSSSSAYDNYEWTKGPSLNGPKPDPFVVVANEKIYVLANIQADDEPEFAFEVFDPNSDKGCWVTLPVPPFFSLYVLKVVVMDNAILVLVLDYNKVESIFCFDLEKVEWKMPTMYMGNLILDNLMAVKWNYSRAATDCICMGKYLFQFSGVDDAVLYAYDLSYNKQQQLPTSSSTMDMDMDVGEEDEMAKSKDEDFPIPDSLNPLPSFLGEEDLLVNIASGDTLFPFRCPEYRLLNPITWELKEIPEDMKSTLLPSWEVQPHPRDKIEEDEETKHCDLQLLPEKIEEDEETKNYDFSAPKGIEEDPIGDPDFQNLFIGVDPSCFSSGEDPISRYAKCTFDNIIPTPPSFFNNPKLGSSLAVPVYGLHRLRKLLPRENFTSGFVTHIREQKFSLVTVFSHPATARRPVHELCICTFQVDEDEGEFSVPNRKLRKECRRFLCAKNTCYAVDSLDDGDLVVELCCCCKM